VINDFKLTASSRAQMLVALGYNVVSIDGRGTPGRGRRFETALYRNLGSLEVPNTTHEPELELEPEPESEPKFG